MKKLFLLFFLVAGIVVSQAQVIIVNGCNGGGSNISGPYYLAGTDASGRNIYEGNYSHILCNYGQQCRPQTISYNALENIWQLKVGAYYIEAENTDATTPNPPTTGWTQPEYSYTCPNMTISFPVVAESNDCVACNWSDPNTWVSGSVPTASDHVTINGNVILDVNASILNLTINAGKSLIDVADKTITVKGKFENNGFLKTLRLTIQGYKIPQTLDGTKVNIQNLTVDNLGGLTLTGDLAVLKPGGSSTDNVQLREGSIFLGDYNFTCHGVSRSFENTMQHRIVTNGTGSLKYQLPGGSINVEFPVGKGASGLPFDYSLNYAPLNIMGTANSVSGQPVIIAVNASNFNPAHTIPDNTRNIKTEWTISSVHQTLEQPYTVKFGWTVQDTPEGFNMADNTYVKRWNGTDWENKEGPLPWGYYPGPGYGVSVSNVTEFSSWGVFDSDAVLPVTLTEFKAIAEGSITVLNWVTTEEINSSGFEVEHGTNGKDWQKIGEMVAKGESSALERYTYTHYTPVEGDNYYRLKMLDHDMTFAYSRIRVVKVNSGAMDYLYPNPTTDKIYLKNTERIKKALLLNNLGNIVLDTSSNIQNSISVTGVASGVYILHVLYNNGSAKSQKVVIK